MAATSLLGDEIVGEVQSTFYADEDSGFGVIEMLLVEDPDGAAEDAEPEEPEAVRCTGPLARVVEGQALRLVGSYVDHPRYGRTFEATFYEQVTPSTVAGLRTFLRSERFADVPPRVITRVLTTFGAAAGGIIERQPERISAEADVDPIHVEKLTRAWEEGRVMAQLVRLVEPVKMPTDVVQAIVGWFGPDAATIAKEDPYRLVEVPRCRFAHADSLAKHLGVPLDDTSRLVAGARAALGGAQRRDGHQYLPLADAIQATQRLLNVDAILAREGLDGAVGSGLLAVERLDEVDGPVEAVYTARGIEHEAGLADHLLALRDAPTPRARARATHVDLPAELTIGQQEAVVAAFEHAVSVLTGGPGTGKTRTIAEIVRNAETFGLDVALCAPTGRAAKRLEELVGRPATTIHRLLQARPTGGGGFTFRHGPDEPLELDMIVVDEVSMCDTALASALIRAVEQDAHVILVGDADQLPSVGPGDVLRDILRSSAIVSTRLTEIHRQAAGSRIVSLAREVNAGDVGVLKGNDGDVFLAESERNGVVARVVEAVANRIPGWFGIESSEVQVVAPVYRGPVGVDALNAALREALNPATDAPEIAGMRVGDRVLQTRNDPDLDVANGDIGTVVEVRTGKQRSLVVKFPRGHVDYDPKQARDLTHAWAITVHKSQGGEWPVVVLVCDTSHQGMLWRNLVYTALTRAQRGLILVGQSSALRRAAVHDRPSNRHTGLAARLRAATALTLSPQGDVVDATVPNQEPA